MPKFFIIAATLVLVLAVGLLLAPAQRTPVPVVGIAPDITQPIADIDTSEQPIPWAAPPIRENLEIAEVIEEHAQPLAAMPMPVPVENELTALSANSEGGIAFEAPMPTAIAVPTMELAKATAEPTVIATHTFAGPQEFPPEGYLAYGVLAFPQKPTPDTEHRYHLICEAFIKTISFTSEVSQPISAQMVTIWPVTSAQIAKKIHAAPEADRCKMAIAHYHLPHSERAIEFARMAGQKLGTGRGPFLLAWSPGGTMGSSKVPVLERDLSLVVTRQQANDEFRAWKAEIRNRECWDCSKFVERSRRNLRLYADYYGARTIGALRALFGNDALITENDDA